MDENRFRDYYLKRNLSKEVIQAHVELLKEFELFLKRKAKRDLREASPSDAKSFIAYKMEKGGITLDEFRALIRYSSFLEKKETISVLYGYLEGFGVPEELAERLNKTLGERKTQKIFEGIDFPPLGTIPEDKPKITKRIMERLEAHLDEKSLKEIISSGLEVGPDEWYLPKKKMFQESKNIDDFLKKIHKEFIKTLEKHYREKKMFFAQEIDDEVLEYVRKNQEIGGGVRKGKIIYVTKIPYLTKKYLHEKDEKMKRYYACHCSWVREAIKSNNPKISPNFCYCSAGYHKRPFEVAFDQPVKADVLKTVMKGDYVCRFAISIPQQFLET